MSQEVQLKTLYFVEMGRVILSFSDDDKALAYQKKVPSSEIHKEMSLWKVHLPPPANLTSIRAGQDESYLLFFFKHPAAAKAWKKLSLLGDIKDNRVWIKQYWQEDELDKVLEVKFTSEVLGPTPITGFHKIMRKIDRGAKHARGSRDH